MGCPPPASHRSPLAVPTEMAPRESALLLGSVHSAPAALQGHSRIADWSRGPSARFQNHRINIQLHCSWYVTLHRTTVLNGTSAQHAAVLLWAQIEALAPCEEADSLHDAGCRSAPRHMHVAAAPAADVQQRGVCSVTGVSYRSEGSFRSGLLVATRSG